MSEQKGDGPNVDTVQHVEPDADVLPAGQPDIAVVGVVSVVVAFFVALAGLFVLPLNTYPFPGSDIGFVEIRSFAALVNDRSVRGSFEPFSTLGAFWWQYGALIAATILALLVVAGVAAADKRAFGWVIAVLSLVGGVLHGLALAQSSDLRSGARFLIGYSKSNIYDHAGIGVWVSLSGFGLLVVAGVVLAVLSPRRTYSDSPIVATASASA